MQKHNYVDLELVKLLPDNPYRYSRSSRTPFYWLKVSEKYIEYTNNKAPARMVKEQKDWLKQKGESGNISIIDAWTWEDIRLYINSKRYEYSIDVWTTYDAELNIHHKKYSCRLFFTTGQQIELQEDIWFDTYEEAREYSIKECLRLIDQQ